MTGFFVSVKTAIAVALAGLYASLLAGSGAGLVGFLQSGLGAVLRTVLDKLSESVSTKDFGAVGDGVTDDTAAVQAAVTYCLSFETPLANGQSLIPRLKVAGLSRLTAPITLDRVEGGQTGLFRMVGEGAAGGFVINTGLRMFGTTLAGNTEISKSNLIAFENLQFQGSPTVQSWIIHAGKFVRLFFTNCAYRQIQLADVAAAGVGQNYLQSVYVHGGVIRETLGPWINAVDLYDVKITGTQSESNAGTIVKASGIAAGCSFDNNLVQSVVGSFVDVGELRGASICGNYAESNHFPFVKAAAVNGCVGQGNYIYTRGDAPNNQANSEFYEFDFGEVTGFLGGGNNTNGRLYKCTGTAKNLTVGAGDRAELGLANQYFNDQRFGRQIITVDGLQEKMGVASNRISAADVRSVAAGTVPFFEVDCGAYSAAMVVTAVACGLKPGIDYMAFIGEWFVTRSGVGAWTVTAKQSQAAGAGAGAITATATGNKLTLSYVYSGSSPNTFNTSIAVQVVAGDTARQNIAAAIV